MPRDRARPVGDGHQAEARPAGRDLPYRLQPGHHAVRPSGARAGLKFGALVGHGAGYGVYEKLKEGMGSDVNYVFNTDPISIWLAKPEGA